MAVKFSDIFFGNFIEFIYGFQAFRGDFELITMFYLENGKTFEFGANILHQLKQFFKILALLLFSRKEKSQRLWSIPENTTVLINSKTLTNQFLLDFVTEIKYDYQKFSCDSFFVFLQDLFLILMKNFSRFPNSVIEHIFNTILRSRVRKESTCFYMSEISKTKKIHNLNIRHEIDQVHLESIWSWLRPLHQIEGS